MTAEPGRLKDISMGLSGGGTRAAGFHLGAMSYLNRVGLLQDVKIMSSASGGSIVNATYAMACAQGKSFDAYLPWIINKLQTAEMIEWVLQELSTAEAPLEPATDGRPARRRARNLSGRRSMVVALAEVYDRHFFGGFRLGQLNEKPPGHLNEVVINATDFRTGLGFRFQRHTPVGNGRTPLDADLMRHVRLADVMAASSCLPGGLEPFFFPEDFVWDGDEAVRDAASIQARLRNLGVESVPLMDGGIYDNQGLESLILAASRGTTSPSDTAMLLGEKLVAAGDDSQRRLFEFDLLFQRIATGEAPEEPPGLVIVSDIPLDADPVYRGGYAADAKPPLRTVQPPDPNEGITLGGVKVWWRFLIALCTGSALALGIEAWHWGSEMFNGETGHNAPYEILVYTLLNFIPFTLSVGALFVLWWARKQMRAVIAQVDEVLATEGVHSAASENVQSSWAFIKNLRLSHVIYLAKLRVSSVFSLANDVFFIRTRVLSYMLIYMMQGWRERLVTNEIFDVLNASGPDAPQPTEAMRNVVRAASEMPTAFWFERPDDLPHLIAAGQMNMCFNVITYLRRQVRLSRQVTPAMEALLKEALDDWQRLCADPHVFVPTITRPSALIAATDAAKLAKA